MKDQTSWESSSQWYSLLVGKNGHFYHQQMIIPNVLRLLNLKPHSSLLDLACGQGILARAIPKKCHYRGLDISANLIAEAKKMSSGPQREFTVADVCKPLQLNKTFSHATMILAAQNIENPELAFNEAFKHLIDQGLFLIVLNHPSFRIPRQSHWGVEESKKIQYRRMDRYMSPLKIPIQTHPGKGKSTETTLSFHYPISSFTQWLFDAGFIICGIEEWISEKQSSGKTAKMENRARQEFPLFLTILAQKLKD